MFHILPTAFCSLFRHSVRTGVQQTCPADTPEPAPACLSTSARAGCLEACKQWRVGPVVFFARLGQAELHGGHELGDHAHFHAQGFGCVEHARAVQVHRQALTTTTASEVFRVQVSIIAALNTGAPFRRNGRPWLPGTCQDSGEHPLFLNPCAYGAMANICLSSLHGGCADRPLSPLGPNPLHVRLPLLLQQPIPTVHPSILQGGACGACLGVGPGLDRTHVPERERPPCIPHLTRVGLV